MDNAKVSASSLERGGEDGRSTSVAYAWFVVTFLMVLLTSSFIDRTILSLLVKPIRADLHLTDTQFSYLAGLAQAGIRVERIPSLAEMNARLARLGWRAVAG